VSTENLVLHEHFTSYIIFPAAKAPDAKQLRLQCQTADRKT